MPKENKKRGRRGEKRKHEDRGEEVVDDHSSKRRKPTPDDDAVAAGEDYIPLKAAGDGENVDDAYPAAYERPFFGMLDEEEQDYFKQADDMLEANNFAEPEERTLFLANVYKEADGKELKIAQSQSCSRLMERLIQLSDAAQMKGLFQKFAGNFIHLISHRFASHCCEALFLRAGPMVTHEMKTSKDDLKSATNVNLDTLFLQTLKELEGNFGFLMTDRYASHVLRVLLLVLAGEPFDQASTQHLLKSKRKENVVVQGARPLADKSLEQARIVPKSFTETLEALIAGSVAGLDTDKLRALSTHPNGSPTLQLLLKLELTHFGKQRAKDESSIIRTLLPDDPITSDCSSAHFISGIVYDATGSHLVEKIIEHAPGKTFRNLYKEFFKERIASLARNDIAQYVVCRILERMSKDDLFDAHEMLVPTVSSLLEKDHTIVIRTLIERCAVRGVDTQAITVAIEKTWHTSTGFEVKELLKIDCGLKADGANGSTHDCTQNSGADATPVLTPKAAQASKAHFNVLAQAMLLVPGPLSALILESLTRLDSPTVLKMSRDFVVSRTLQQALTTTNASMIERRKLIQLFYGHFGEMASDNAASHIVDCVWEGTHGLAFIRERIAEELAENEAHLRESPSGRAVWRNWKMDLYKRRRLDWIKQSKYKASNDGFQSWESLSEAEHKLGAKKPHAAAAAKKTPLQLARERHARKKGRSSGAPSTGANAEASRTSTASG